MTTAQASSSASYARISDNDGAGPGVGCADQHRRNRKRADTDGLTIAHELTDDDRSAYSEDVTRDDYQKLLTLVGQGAIRFVLVKHADRLHRKPAEAEEFIRLARRHGVTVVTASGMRYLLDTADGRRAFRDAANAASYESEHRGERVAESRERRALAGEYGGGPRRPFGWGVPTGVVRRVRDKKTGESRDVEILDMGQHRPEEAAEIRRWKRELLSGVPLAQVLRSIALPTVTGSAMWGSRTLHHILTSPRTSGHSVYKGEIVARNAWPAILTDDEREALKALLTDPSRKTSPGNTPKWFGSMIYLCGHCDDGTPMTCRYTNGGQRVYRCRVKGHCQRDAESIDAYIAAIMVERLSRDDVADLIATRPDVDVAKLREEEKALHERKKGLALKAAVGTIDDEMLAVATAEIRRRLGEIGDQLRTVTTESPLADFVGADDARKVWKGLGLGRQREVIRTLANITLLPVGRGRRPKSAPPIDPDTVVFNWQRPSSK